MKGVAIAAKCQDCGQILAYDGATWSYYCPECEAKKAEVMKPLEWKKAA